MAAIAQRIKLYNKAFHLARQYMAKDSALADRAGIVKELHDAIRREIGAGNEDVVAIAAAAVRELQARHGARDPEPEQASQDAGGP